MPKDFLKRVSQRVEGLEPRLPTEAQWEYACRAEPTASAYADSGSILGDFAWYRKNSGNSTQEVGLKAPNRWGLFDMLGNVFEWCADFWSRYESANQRDPLGPSVGTERVIRGGSWSNEAALIRAAYRARLEPSSRSDRLGFRFR